MKRKMLIPFIFIVVMLVISPIISAFKTTPKQIITSIKANQNELFSSKEKPIYIGLETITVKVYYADWRPCAGATVRCLLWFGFLWLPVLVLMLTLLIPVYIAELTKKTTDETGTCTFLKPALLQYAYLLIAQKDDFRGMLLSSQAPGDIVCIYLDGSP
jgi:hypothetical protein